MGDLPEDLASANVIRDVVVDLDPSIDRAGMHHDALRREVRSSFAGEAVLNPIIRSDAATSGALELDSKHHDHIKIANVRVKIVGDLHTITVLRNMGKRRGQQRWRSNQPNRCSKCRQGMEGTASHPTVGNIADDRNSSPLDPSKRLSNGQAIKKALRRMLMATVACIDHGAADVLGQEGWTPGKIRPDHQRVHPQGLHVESGIQE